MTKKPKEIDSASAVSKQSAYTPQRTAGLKQFQPGQSGNPKGRAKGSRNKLGEDFLCALQADFKEHGEKVIETVRIERPADYLKLVAGILPKELNVTTNAVEDLTDEELEAAIEILRRQVNSRDDDVPPHSTH